MRNSNICREAGGKSRFFQRGLLAALALACSASFVHALDPNRILSQYMREHWGSERGFTGGSVTALAQSSDGYLWIGTEKGLIRFDGFGFRAFPQGVPVAFPIGPVQSLTSDAQGNLWILLQSTRILRYHDGKFELGRELAEFGITSLFKRGNGSVIFASLAYGPLIYNSGKFEMLNPSSPSPNSSSNGGEVTTDELSSRLSWATGVAPHRFAEPNSAVISMAETSDGKIWLGTRDKGLFYSVDGKVTAVPTGLPDASINCLLAGNRDLWIGTDKGVLRWDGAKVTSLEVPVALRRLHVLSMARDRDSNIWFGTPGGLVRLNSGGVVLDAANSQTSGAVNALLEDREGNLWAGRPSGIERLRDSAFITYSAPGLQSENTGPVYVDRNERVWFAPFEGGLHWLKGEKSGSVPNDRLNQDVVYSIAGANDELWIGRQQGGLTRLRYTGGTLTTRTYTQADGLAQNSVYAVFQSRDGAVWAGTLSGGLSELRNGRFTTYTRADGLPSNSITSIAETSGGTMWFATPNGLSSFSGGHWHSLGVREGLPSPIVNCLLTDSADLLWIGTASGLAYAISGQVQVPTAVPASLHEQILGIGEDKLGWLWISTSNHVLRVKRDNLLRNSLSDADVREYSLEDGLHGTEGVKRQQSVFADPQGKIWFSMNRGISVADPSRANFVSAPAILHMEEASSDGTPLAIAGPIRLTGAHRRLTFAFSALSLSIPERIRYKYKLDGVDESWSRPVIERQVTYNNLGSGNYRFHVVASNSEGLWNGAESELGFKIEPAYWQTWWFRLSGVLAFFLAVLGFVRLRMRALASQMNMRFEERLAERTRIAQELHDTLLQGFLSASMQLHVADDRLPEDSPAKPLLGRVLQLMGRVIDEGRNTVRGLRSPEIDRENLEEELSRIQKDLAISTQSEFRVIVEGASRQLRQVIHDEIYFIGREALANAFRHSGASEIILEIEYSSSHLRVLVRDNGCGVDPQVVSAGRDGHWGLSGMRERAERIGGKLKVLSMPSAGTEIHLSVPGRLAFEPQSSSRRSLWFSRLYSRKAPDEKTQPAGKQPR